MFALKARDIELYLSNEADEHFVITRLVCSKCNTDFYPDLLECYFCGEINYYLLVMIKYKLVCKNCGNFFDSWFASSKEYYYGGGIDGTPPIRMYNLYEPHPHFSYHTDVGMVPDMKEAKAWCTFYEAL